MIRKSRPLIAGTLLIMLTSIGESMSADEMERRAGWRPILRSRPANRGCSTRSLPRPRTAARSTPRKGAIPRQASGDKNSATQRRGRVLLAEDNEVNQLVASEVLIQAGFCCDIVDNGVAAAEAVARGHYDLVLMDCQMPLMDGFEATRAIRERERQQGGKTRLPIVALTANAIKGDRELCIDSGMDAYITKPIDPTRLIETIQAVLADTDAAAPTAGAQTSGGTNCSGTVSWVSANARGLKPTLQSTPEPIELATLLDRCQGKTALCARVLTKFSERAEEYGQRIAKGIAAAEFSELARAAHALKGAAANLSAEQLQQAAAEIERLAGECRLPTSVATERLHDALQAVIAAIPRLVEDLSADRPGLHKLGLAIAES